MPEPKNLIISVRYCRTDLSLFARRSLSDICKPIYRIIRVLFFRERTLLSIELCSFSQMQFTVGYCEDRTPFYVLLQITLFLAKKKTKISSLLYTWFRASWIEFNNCPTRCDLFSLLHFCRQLYMFRVLKPINRSSYNCNYSF